MDGKQIVGGFVLLIAVYLLVQNATNTNAVITGLSGGITNTVMALQGKTPTSNGLPTITGLPTIH